MQKVSVVYFLTRSLFLGFGISLLFSISSKDAYLGAICGLLVGIFLTFIYSYLIKKKGDKSILDILSNKGILGIIVRIILIAVSFIILLYMLVSYKEFVGAFLLVNSPELYFLIPIIILTLYLALKGFKIISRVASCLIPFSIILSLISFVGLVVFFEPSNFLPILSTKFDGFVKTAFAFAGISFLPNLLTIHLKGDIKGYTKIYILASSFIILTIICVNGVFGPALVNIFRFPEYMVLKQLKLFKFIEKIENVISCSWILDLFITMSMAIFSLKELIGTKHAKKITIALVLGALFILEIFFDTDYINELKIYYILPNLSLILILLTLFSLYLVLRKIKD